MQATTSCIDLIAARLQRLIDEGQPLAFMRELGVVAVECDPAEENSLLCFTNSKTGAYIPVIVRAWVGKHIRFHPFGWQADPVYTWERLFGKPN